VKNVALYLLLLWQPAQTAFGEDSLFVAIAQRGIAKVYNLEFEKAEEEFVRLTQMQPAHPAGYFFLAMVDWWRIMIDIDNEEYDDRFVSALNKVIDLCDERLDKNENDVTALFFKGGSLGFKGRLRFHRDDWFAAADAGRRALPIVQDASASDPHNFDIFLGTGIYNYYAAVIPELYPMAKPLLLFIPHGDKEKGIRQLKLAAEKGTYGRVESAYFLMQLYYQYEKRYNDALAIAQRLHEQFPNNMLFHKYVGRCYVVLSNWDSARVVFDEIVQRGAKGFRGYNASTLREAEYYLGLDNLLGGHFEDAERHFIRCDELSRTLDADGPSGFMVMANLKLGNAYDAQSKRELATQQYHKVLDMKEYQQSHDQADHYLTTPYFQ